MVMSRIASIATSILVCGRIHDEAAPLVISMIFDDAFLKKRSYHRLNLLSNSALPISAAAEVAAAAAAEAAATEVL